MVASSVIFLLRISEHFVVSDHCEIMASYELIEPLHEGFQHAKSFQLVGKISTLCWSEFLWHESGRMGSLPVFTLCENSAHPSRACISYHPDAEFSLILLSGLRRNFPNNWFKNRHFSCNCFDFIKTFLMEWGPSKRQVVAADCLQWTWECANIWHKMGQIFYKTEEPKNLIMVPWDSPISDLCHLVRVGMYPICVNLAAKDV